MLVEEGEACCYLLISSFQRNFWVALEKRGDVETLVTAHTVTRPHPKNALNL
jgi:hypothetical protein